MGHPPVFWLFYFYFLVLFLSFLGVAPLLFVLCVEMANSANTNTVVRTWFGGRRGLRSGGSNGRTGRGRGRWRLPASTLSGHPRGRRRRHFPPPASGGAGRGGGRRARGGARAPGRGEGGGAAGPGAVAGRSGPRRPLGRGERAAPAPDPGRREGARAGGEPPLAPEVGPAALAREGLPEQPQNQNRAWGVGRVPKTTVIHCNAVGGSRPLWG